MERLATPTDGPITRHATVTMPVLTRMQASRVVAVRVALLASCETGRLAELAGR
jgi:hypothetical protein